MKKKKIILDMAINIVASVLPVFFLQLWILPNVSRRIGDDRYGLVVTLVALLSVIPATFGNVLNNIRLLKEEEYKEHGVEGDFNCLLLISETLSFFLVAIISGFYLGSFDFIQILLLGLVAVLWLAREYFVVTFRIRLNYIAILIDDVILSIGHVVGWCVFIFTDAWQFIYIIGYLFSLTYILFNTSLYHEKLIKTKFFNSTAKDSILLLFSNILNRLMTYADKLLLYPLLGGALVSIYYSASIFSKIASLAITPITSVILSYISKIKQKPDKLFSTTFYISSVICAVVYFGCLVLGRPILSMIYPQYVNEAVKYIPLTSAAMVFSTLSTVINPFILRFFDMNWQIKVNTVSLVVYVLLSYVFLKLFGLYGFCIGVMLTNILRTTFLIYIYKKKS